MSKFSDITKLKEKLVNDISKSEDISQLEDIRISSLGKKGSKLQKVARLCVARLVRGME